MSSQDSAEKSARFYSATNVIRSAQSLNLSDIPSVYGSIISGPCFKPTFLWASCVGILFAGHRFKQGAQLGHAARDTAMRMLRDVSLSFSGTFGVQWYLCRLDDADRRLAVRAFYASREQAVSHLPAREDESDNASGDSDEGWKTELERLTRYDLPTVQHGPSDSVRMQ